ncbi:sensor histidine kinase [Microvirga terrestris]|uniref:Blue-light-activated histidine kinase n=1 Tax=Microvirga terrestris TaxID=2791024 RepID=A0ABS0HUA1_9HYPH|nr:PAS domain S-box protein [Microvirga terrestris]MBF9196944.1 PAS domain S-box protein [Microvirga terrestris]
MGSNIDKATGKSKLRSLSPLKLRPALNVDVLTLVADAVICTDQDGHILVFNQAAEQSFGYHASEVIGQRVEVLIPENQRADHLRQVRKFGLGYGAASRLMGRRREVTGRRKNGDEFPAEAMVSRQTIDGRMILTVVIRDITERKELEKLRDVVAREMDHRMRNVLAVVSSLVSLSAANAVDVEDFKESLLGRLKALAATQGALRFGEQQSTSLRELLVAELAQYQTSGETNLTVGGPPVSVGPAAAQILALTLHELATNSAKYGALHNANGHVSVISAYTGEGDDQIMIQWQETGGPLVKPPERKGSGTDLIKQLVGRALRADVAIEYRPEGLVCRMTLPRATVEAGCSEQAQRR